MYDSQAQLWDGDGELCDLPTLAALMGILTSR